MVKDIFVPKSEKEILADLLETDPRNVYPMIKFYKELKKYIPISSTYSLKTRLNFINDYVFNNSFPDEKSAGISALKRNFIRWKNGVFDDGMMYETLLDYFNFVYDAKFRYEHWCKRKFESFGSMNESLGSVFKPKNTDKIIENLKGLSLKSFIHSIFKINVFYECIEAEQKILLLKNVPLIIQIWLKLRDEGAVLRSFEYNYLEDGFATLFFRYKKTNEIIRQYENENFVVFVSNKNYPLLSQKIYDVETFMKIMAEKTKGEV